MGNPKEKTAPFLESNVPAAHDTNPNKNLARLSYRRDETQTTDLFNGLSRKHQQQVVDGCVTVEIWR